MIAFHDKLKQTRISKGLTQMQLAKLVNIPQQNISSYEQGNSRPKIYKLSEICSNLGLTIDELFENCTL